MGDKKPKSYHQYSRHVSGALIPDKLDFYRKHPGFLKKRFPTLQAEWFKDISSGIVNGINVLSWTEDFIRSNEPVIDLQYKTDWNLTWEVLIQSLDLQIRAMTQGLKHANPELFLKVLGEMKEDEGMIAAGKSKIFIINIHNDLEETSEKGNQSFYLKTLPDIEFVGDLVVLHKFPGGPLVITYQMLVNCMDKIEAKFSWMFYIEYMSRHPDRVPYNTKELFYAIYNLMEDAYREVGNDAIRVFKLLEPLLVGICLQELDPVTHDHAFGFAIRDTFLIERSYLNKYVLGIWKIGKQYLSQHGEKGIPFLLEQYGQEKLHNYPIVLIEDGLKKMHAYGTSIRVSQEQAVRDLAADFKREYFVAYYEKHKILPKVIDNWRLDPRIRRMIARGKPGSLRECFKIDNEAWYRLEYEKNHDFNYFPQISDLLDDKAITPHLESIYQLFAQDALDVMNLRKPYTYENSRLILEILARPEIDIREFYRTVEELGYIPKNWAVIQLMAKERELKIEARVFSILTFECRMMASACERNIGEQILPLFKQQSMTLTGSELKHKMDILSTLPETDEYVWVAFHHDLQQWNYTFRSYQQAHLILVLCTLFGVNHFMYLMNIFTDSKLFSANKFAPPGFPDTFTFWDTHAGGNQGIFQKFWTLITLIAIRGVVNRMDLDHRLTGSGDNQVLFVKLKKSGNLKELIATIKKRIQTAFEDIGLSLKIEETWASSRLVCYQRKYYFDGVLIPGGVKISARAFSGSGDVNAGLNATVTTAINGGISLTEQHSDPLIGPSFAYTEIFLSLLGHNTWKKYVPHEIMPLVLLSMLSSDFGFLPFIQLSSFMYAGHQDTLSESLALLKYIWDHYPQYRPHIAGAVSFKVGSHDADARLQLILEPTTLNIDRPKLPEAIIREKVEEYLLDPVNVRNNQLRTMFSCCKKEDQLQLANELLKIRPINTALTHSLFQCSHIGGLLVTFSRFNKVSSLVKLVGLNKVGTGDVCFSAKVRHLDIANLKYFFWRIRAKVPRFSQFIEEVCGINLNNYHYFCHENNLHTDCTFSLRLFLISYTYGLGNNLVTGPYTPAPSEQLVFHDSGLPEDLSSSLIVSPSYDIPINLHELEHTRGCYSLYIGSRTVDPVRTIKLTTLDGVEAGTAIKTLLKILAWMKSTKSGGNVTSFITQQIGIRMEGLEKLIPGLVPGTAGGCIDHRFGSPGTVMWAYSNSTSLISTWYQITSNQAKELQRGEDDRFIFFQQLYQHIFGALRFCSPYKERFSVRIRLDHCSYIIPPSQFQSPTIYLPGKDRIQTGLILDPDRKEALRLEAEHFTNVMSNSALHQGSGEEILGAAVGHQVAQQISMYSLGLEDLNLEEHKINKNQTSINLTLIRKLTLKRILASVGLHLAATGYFGKVVTSRKVQQFLLRRSTLGTIGQSAVPFLDIIQALITSGYLSSLFTYTGCSWVWDGSSSIITLLGPLLKGIAYALRDWRREGFVLYLMVEVKGSHFQYKKLLQFLYHWNPAYARLLRNNPDLPSVRLIEEINIISEDMKILLITDKGIAVEYGRRKLSSEEIETSLALISIPTPCHTPNLNSPPSPPWILSRLTSEPEFLNMSEAINTIINQRDQLVGASKNLTRLMRWNKASSGGKYKLSEIISRLSITIPENSSVVCLGEGAGSFLSFLLHYQPLVDGFYNSIVKPDDTPPAMAGLYRPPDLFCPCNIIHRVINLPELSSTYGDLLKEPTWVELDHHITKNGKEISLITLDMQYIPKETNQVIRRLTTQLGIWRATAVIIKFTLELLLEIEDCQLDEIGKYYSLCQWIKPTFSNPYSTEVYLVLTEPSSHQSKLSSFTKSSLVTDWILHNTLLDQRRIGQALVDGLDISWNSNMCPGYLYSGQREETLEFGSIWLVLKDPFAYLFNVTYKRFILDQELDRTEQIVLRSASKLAESTRGGFYSITKAVEVYLTIRGLIFSEASHGSLMYHLQSNPLQLLQQLDKEESSAPSPKAWNEMLKHLGYFLASPDCFQQDAVLLIVRAWLHLVLRDDQFLIFAHYDSARLRDLTITLERDSISRFIRWMDLILQPVSFFHINHLLVDVLTHIGWTSCRVTAVGLEICQLIESLPWIPSLSSSSNRKLVLSRTIEEYQVDWTALSIELPIRIVLESQQGQGSSAGGVLLYTKRTEYGVYMVYCPDHY